MRQRNLIAVKFVHARYRPTQYWNLPLGVVRTKWVSQSSSGGPKSLDCVGNSEWGKPQGPRDSSLGDWALTFDSSLELMDIAQKLGHAHAISMT